MSDRKLNKILVIAGPTATGKTKLALQLAKQFNGELISADSRQIYKGLDIVTGKDILANQIYGYDLIQPGEDWNLSHFQKFAQKIIKKILSQNKLPIIVGGTGLYIKGLLENYSPPPPNPELRQKLTKLSLIELQNYLKKINYDHFDKLNHSDQHNPHRLLRAIEINSSPTKGRAHEVEVEFDPLIIGLTAPITLLEKHIRDRVVKRIKQNPKKELIYLKKFNLGWQTSPATSLGYQELDQYYSGKITKKTLINLWTTHERQYAKRQLTWFNKQKDIHWFDITKPNYQKQVVDLISAWYT